MPILTLLLGLRTAAPLVALLGWTLYLVNLVRYRLHLRGQELARLVLASTVGVPVGLWLLSVVDERWVVGGLGVLVSAFALYSLLRPEGRWIPPRWGIYVAGFLGGCLGGAYTIYGPPVLVYARWAGWSRETFRATLQGFFLLTATLVVLSHAVAGYITPVVVRWYLWMVSALVVGIVVGRGLDRRVSTRRFQQLVGILLMGLGMSLLLRGI